eukprot:scaffold6084_cov93-Skeletonema_dohrnii-CCMP3373.AAC.2
MLPWERSRRMYCCRRLTLTLSPLLHGGQREHNVGCLTQRVRKIWLAELFLSHDVVKFCGSR